MVGVGYNAIDINCDFLGIIYVDIGINVTPITYGMGAVPNKHSRIPDKSIHADL